MGPRPGSEKTDSAGFCAAAEDGTGDLDYLIQRIFTAGVLLGDALASGTGTVAAAEDAISELDEGALIIRSAVLHGSVPDSRRCRVIAGWW